MSNMNFSIPFEILVKTIKYLDLQKQQQLLEILEDKLFEVEEEWEKNPEIIAEVEAAKKAYQTGDYLTIEEFISS
ncbi:MAG: hypothetical protein AB4060_00740 [Crocosphaera sp.]